jgi:hypothetical protein
MLRNMSWKAAAVTAVAATISLGLLGCDGKIAQCNRLIEVINKEQGPLKKATGNDPAALKKLADTLDDVAKKVEAVELKDEPWSGYARKQIARQAQLKKRAELIAQQQEG